MTDDEVKLFEKLGLLKKFWASLNVLIVDDVDYIRSALKGMLFPYKFNELFDAKDGAEALGKIVECQSKGLKIDLVIADISMPRMTGIELLQNVKKFSYGKDIRFLILTTRNDIDTVLEAINSGADNYIIKPFDEGIIKKKLVEIFSNKIRFGEY